MKERLESPGTEVLLKHETFTKSLLTNAGTQISEPVTTSGQRRRRPICAPWTPQSLSRRHRFEIPPAFNIVILLGPPEILSFLPPNPNCPNLLQNRTEHLITIFTHFWLLVADSTNVSLSQTRKPLAIRETTSF